MSNDGSSVKKYGETQRYVRKIIWEPTEMDNMEVYKKVSQWIMLHKETKIKAESPDADTLNIPEEIPNSPVFNARKRLKLDDLTHECNNDGLRYPKTPSRTSNYRKIKNASPIVRRQLFSARARKFYCNNEIKQEVSSLNNEINCSQSKFPKLIKQKNSTSPVIISKRYSFRKRERSYSIDENFSQLPNTIPLKIENVEDSPVQFTRNININRIKSNIPFSIRPSCSQQIDLVESEEECNNDDKENDILDNESFSVGEISSIHNIIDDLYSQEIYGKEVAKLNISTKFSQNSDETYCSFVENKVDIQSAETGTQSISRRMKQNTNDLLKISQILSYPVTEKTAANESEVSNLQHSNEGNGTRFNFSVSSGTRRKRKMQKNSLLDKLNNLVGTAASFNRLWYHQITQPQFKGFYTKFVVLNIISTYPFNGRQFFECEIYKDDDNLLCELMESSSSRKITVIVIPEIVGNIIVPDKSNMKLYPPWKIIDKESQLLEAPHFLFDEKSDNINLNNTKVANEMIIKFSCACLKNNRICKKDCYTRFTNCKPSIIKELFNY